MEEGLSEKHVTVNIPAQRNVTLLVSKVEEGRRELKNISGLQEPKKGKKIDLLLGSPKRDTALSTLQS